MVLVYIKQKMMSIAHARAGRQNKKGAYAPLFPISALSESCARYILRIREIKSRKLLRCAYCMGVSLSMFCLMTLSPRLMMVVMTNSSVGASRKSKIF